jgi:glycosyltransferase involved in cell wall biosynthesis
MSGETLRIAYYCPMKPPDDATPSGDRLMAAQIMHALGHTGDDVRLVSRLRSWLAMPDPTHMAAVEAEAQTEARRLIATFTGHSDGPSGNWRPDLWLTYHLYYRAPDLIGPAVSQALNIPYAALEASHASKREHGPWARWAGIAADAMRRADLLGALTRRDLAALEGLPARAGRLAIVPPFLVEAGGLPPARQSAEAPPDQTRPVRIVTVAMMRAGTKQASYEMMAAALRLLPLDGWTLTVIGTGAERAGIESTLRAVCAERVSFTGKLSSAATRAHLDEADIFFWPGHREAYGMVFLEAAAAGLPVVACASGGVGDVTRAGETALLTPEGDVPALADALLRLIGDAPLRRRLGLAGARFVRQERGLEQAAMLLRQELDAVLAAREQAA